MGKGGVQGSNTQPTTPETFSFWDLFGQTPEQLRSAARSGDAPYGIPNAPRPPATQPAQGGKKSGGGAVDPAGIRMDTTGGNTSNIPVQSFAKPSIDVMPSVPEPTTPRSRSGTRSPYPWSMPY